MRHLKKPLVVFVLAFVAYLVLSVAENGEAKFSSLKVTLLHESAHVAFYVTVGAVLIALIAEALGEHLSPLIERGLSDLSGRVAGEVGKGISAGFGDLQSAVSSALNRQREPQWEAVKKTTEDPNEPPEEKEIARLLLSSGKEDLEHAAAILAQRPVNASNYIRAMKNYTTLAYQFWSIGLLDRAIESAENGLKVITTMGATPSDAAEKQKLEEVESTLKSSLAYYYADTGKAEYEDVARRYAAESLANPYFEREKLDTQGFVLIVYGKSKEEIRRGLKMCSEAWSRGLPDASYHRHFERAMARLTAFD